VYGSTITALSVAIIGDENAITRSRLLTEWSSAMFKRRRVKDFRKLERRLTEEALRLRNEAKDMVPGAERERLINRAREAEIVSQMSEWLRSPGLPPPT